MENKCLIKLNNIVINKSTINAIVGPNNCGKTTILKDIYSKLKKEETLYIDNDNYDLLKDISDSIKTIIVDDLCVNSTQKVMNSVLKTLKKLNKERKTTIICTTLNLECIVDFTYIYVVDQNEVVLQGTPMEVLVEDAKLSRLGLDIPLMYDLSVKLSDYNILDKVELDMDRMVETIWK